jgi:hypothetical protein
MKALGKAIEVHWFDAGHGSLVVDQSKAAEPRSPFLPP